MTELINRLGDSWARVSVTITEIGEPHKLDAERGGSRSLCVVCQMKTGKFKLMGMNYCPSCCPCPGCQRSGNG